MACHPADAQDLLNHSHQQWKLFWRPYPCLFAQCGQSIFCLSASQQHCVNVLFAVCSGVVLQVLFHPKQLMLVTSGDDSDVRVWDLVSKSCVAVLKVLLTAVCYLLTAYDLEAV
jgi:WD40 repeat protein